MPLLAMTNVPSMKHSSRSRPSLSFKSLARARKIASITPILTHRWKRLWHVWYGGYRSGKSFQGAPVLRIQRMPFRTSRGFRQGRPRLGKRSSSGIIGSIIAHCSSVRSIVLTPFMIRIALLYTKNRIYEIASSLCLRKEAPAGFFGFWCLCSPGRSDGKRIPLRSPRWRPAPGVGRFSLARSPRARSFHVSRYRPLCHG